MFRGRHRGLTSRLPPRVLPTKRILCRAGLRLIRSRAPSVPRSGRRLAKRAERRWKSLPGRIPRLDPRYLGEIELGWHAPTIVTAHRTPGALYMPLADLVRNL